MLDSSKLHFKALFCHEPAHWATGSPFPLRLIVSHTVIKAFLTLASLEAMLLCKKELQRQACAEAFKWSECLRFSVLQGQEVSVLEMDGQFDKLEELIYVESHLSNTSAKFYGEITQQMLKNSTFPGSTNGTGLFQTIVGLK
eukprot:scaffold98409_cov18-Tisochrysis_lutea.AAC.1